MNKLGYFRFEKLEAWKDVRELTSLVYVMTAKFPSEERFGLVDQIRRAVVSIVLNIAEGSTKGFDLAFIGKNDIDKIYDFALKVNAKLNAFVKSISR